MTTTSTDTTLECETQNENMSTTAKRLVQAAALAAVLVPLGSVAVETAPMTCGFYGGYNGDCASGIGTNEGLTQEYDFGAYKFILSFLSPTGSAFDITISDLHLFDGEFSEREAVSSDTIYQCLPIDPSSTSGTCVEFEVTDSSNGTAWNGYEFTIQWNADTNSLFPNGPGGSVRVLQDPGADPPLFEIDMCVSFGCEYLHAAGRSGNQQQRH